MGNALCILTNLIFSGGDTLFPFHRQENRDLEKLNNVLYNKHWHSKPGVLNFKA